MAKGSDVVAEYIAAEAGWHDASTNRAASAVVQADAARRYIRAIDAYLADLTANGRELPPRLDEVADALREQYGDSDQPDQEQVFKVFRLADGRWMAIKEDDRNPNNAQIVRGWKDIETLRASWRRTDAWAWSVLNEFMDEFGQPARPGSPGGAASPANDSR
jgi:hypothetical protein